MTIIWADLTPEQRQEILTKHVRWLSDESGGQCANLTDANLYGANLTGANLTGANLTGADLGDANLGDANLYGANLGDANLTGANLTDANLTGANLTGANLTGANLTGANLGEIRIVQFGPIGSRKDYTVAHFGPDLDEVRCGCFRGTLAQFVAQIECTYGPDTRHGREYRAAIVLLEAVRASAYRPAPEAVAAS